ncbi:diaminopimelate decarboxylase [Kiritimatiella glycovorans]|uniref:Diaminopimelate decarboxylase n=1 Tax=Kiritimatiella glycovorans TaxID=1307763 RepID=A0A0G3EB45_9BACT|nr:diaminopimelate decarboxylase [Kiritimatiella glycovorans]AKJ63721.1 Diaminopimelate decarboxylase [Kiritimatiella glycovorans]
MNAFEYRNGELHAEDCALNALAEEYGTPLYVYSRTHFEHQYRRLAAALKDADPLLCYSVKGCSTGAILELFRGMGAGLDVVSGGELFRGLRAGFDAEKIVFAGVGKTVDEIRYAIEQGVGFFTVESEPELERIAHVEGELKKSARVAIRVNPDIDPGTHEYTCTGKGDTKFGVDPATARRLSLRAIEHDALRLVGLHTHLGSPLMSVDPYEKALEVIRPLCRELKERGPHFRRLDLGGGLGIPYRPEEEPFDLDRFAKMANAAVGELGLQLVLEPGRFLSGGAGVLLTRVQYVKPHPSKTFLIGDAAMNDLLRPALYDAWHGVNAVRQTGETVCGDLVGPVCETGDFLARDRELPAAEAGDLLAVMNAGAYGYTMASNYNSRPRPAEVLVEGSSARLIRRRETWDDLVRGEE